MRMIIQLALHYVVAHWTWFDFDQKSGCMFRTCLVKRLLDKHDLKSTLHVADFHQFYRKRRLNKEAI